MFPKTLAQANPNASKKGYHAALVLDRCFAVLAFLVIETLHTQISSLFLGKTERRWPIRCLVII